MNKPQLINTLSLDLKNKTKH